MHNNSLPNQLQQLFGVTEQHVNALPGAASASVCLQNEVIQAFQRMQQAALQAGHDLQIASAFRSFERQEGIWARKFAASSQDATAIATILHWSALPGTSRHHWGTDIDVYDATALGEQKLHLVLTEYAEGGPCWPLWRWLQDHALEFGFYWPYQGRGNGVAAEPWHLSYVPLATPYLELWHDPHTIAQWAQLLQSRNLPGSDLLLHDLSAFIRRYTLQVEPIPSEGKM